MHIKMIQETEYYVVAVRKNHGNNIGYKIEQALNERGVHTTFVRQIDASQLPDDALQSPPSTPLFKQAFEKLLNDPENSLHPIIHALEEGKGHAKISEIEKRGKNGIPRERIDHALSILQGHIVYDEEDPDLITCPAFFSKEE